MTNITTSDLIKMLKEQIRTRDNKIDTLIRENKVKIIAFKEKEKKYKNIILLLSILLMILFGISIYHLLI